MQEKPRTASSNNQQLTPYRLSGDKQKCRPYITAGLGLHTGIIIQWRQHANKPWLYIDGHVTDQDNRPTVHSTLDTQYINFT